MLLPIYASADEPLPPQVFNTTHEEAAEAHAVTSIGQELAQANGKLLRADSNWLGNSVPNDLSHREIWSYTIAAMAAFVGAGGAIFINVCARRTRKSKQKLGKTIAERERALLELDRFLNLTSNMTVVIGFDGYFKRVSPAWEMALDYTAEELMAQPFIDFVHPDDRAQTRAVATSMVEHGSLTKFINRYRCKDGSYRVMEWSANAYPDDQYIFAMAHDITERKQLYASLRQREEHFRIITETSPVSIIIARVSDGEILFANPQAGNFFGMAPDDMIGRQAVEFYANQNDRQFIIKIVEKTGRVRNLELMLKRADGTTFLGMASIEALQFDGEDAVLSAVMDITAIHNTQEQLVQVAKLATLGEMASGITHELNQPLAIIRMAAEAAEMELDADITHKEVLTKKLHTVIEQSDRMGTIINHMRQFSRKGTDKHQSFGPMNPVKAAVDMIEHQFKSIGIELETDYPTICRNLHGQAVRLEQVLLNLLNNAKDSVCDKMEQTASVKSDYIPRVQVAVFDEPERDYIRIRVSDNGSGLPHLDHGTIFDPFVTTKEEGHGTGIGLSISYSIINAMSGRIEATNLNEGARFEVTIPVARGNAQPAIRSAAVASAALMASNEKGLVSENYRVRSVLIVDDEVLAAESVAEYLERNGLIVSIATNGAEAIEAFRIQPTDAVITDLRMPTMDGNELIRRLRQQNQNLPIIVTTGHTMVGDDDEILAEGANIVLKKPVRLREILDHLETFKADPART